MEKTRKFVGKKAGRWIKMKYVVRTETTGTFGAALAFDNLADAKEQLQLWLEVDKHPDDGAYDPDWIDYIVSVSDEDADEAMKGSVESEKFIEGVCGEQYHGKYLPDSDLYYPTKKGKKTSLYLSAKLQAVRDEAEKRRKGLGYLLTEIVDRYSTIIKMVNLPEFTPAEVSILSEVVMGSIPTPQMLAGMEWSVMDAATGTEAEKKALADKIRRIPVPERMALVEAVKNGGLKVTD